MNRLSLFQSQIMPRFLAAGPLAAVLAVFLLTACTGGQTVRPDERWPHQQQTDRLGHIIALEERLNRVGGTLLMANASLCRNHVRHLLGFSASNKYSYSLPMASAASRFHGFDERLQVTNVIEGSGARKAGLRKGDILLTIEGRPVPSGPAAEREIVKLLAPIIEKRTSIKMTVLRNDNAKAIQIPLVLACGFRVELGHTDNISAFSDGQRILVTRGMMHFVRNDTELAFVIAKEMAHNVLNHARTLHTTEGNRIIIDNLIQLTPNPAVASAPAEPMTEQYDLDSDTLGLAMALRAGFEIDPATDFWKRLSRASPASNPASYTALHPNSQARLERMPNSIKRLKAAERQRSNRSGGY